MKHGIRLWDPRTDLDLSKQVNDASSLISKWSDERVLSFQDLNAVYWLLPWEILHELVGTTGTTRIPALLDLKKYEGAVWGGLKAHIMRIQQQIFGDCYE